MIATATPNRLAERYAADGYLHVPGVFDAAMLHELETDFDHIVERVAAGAGNARWESASRRLGASADVVWHTHEVQKWSAVWLRALLHPRLLDAATAVLGPDVILHHSKLFCKPPGIGAPFPMHQDWHYFPTEKDTMLAAVIHVAAADEAMGCLRVVPGSHRLGRVAGTGGNEGAANENQDFIRRHRIEDALPVPCAAGDVVFFHYCTVHGSGPNRSDQARKTVLLQLHAGDDAVEAGNRHPNARLCLAGRNHRIDRDSAGR